MTITTETIGSLSQSDVRKMSLGEKWEIVKALNHGIGRRVARKWFKSPAYISMIVSGERNREDIKEYLNTTTEKIIQNYIENPESSKEDLLELE